MDWVGESRNAALRNDRTPQATRVVVLGMGRFGISLASELVRRGSEVLAIDSDPVLVQRYADELTHTAVADTTDAEALRQLDVHDYERAVVGIGTDLEASILTTAVLVDFAVEQIWAKAISRQHGRILERIDAHHVVLPEHDMGERVAHLVTGRMIDYIRFEDDFAMVKTVAPRDMVDRSLAASDVRRRYRITVVGIKAARGGLHLRHPGHRRAGGRPAHRVRPDRRRRGLRQPHLSALVMGWKAPSAAQRATGQRNVACRKSIRDRTHAVGHAGSRAGV